MIHNSVFAVLFSSMLFVANCATTKGATKAELTSCQRAHATCQARLIEANARNADLSAQLGEQKDGNALAQRRIEAYQKLADQFRKAFAAGKLTIILRNGRLVVQLPNAILYDLGKAELKPEGAAVVETLASVLKTIPERSFLIAGHTDNVPISQRSKVFKSNWQLSSMRALRVVLLLQQQGVAPTQLAAAGFGEYLPLADNAAQEGRLQNRRTEIIIMPTISEIPTLFKRL